MAFALSSKAALASSTRPARRSAVLVRAEEGKAAAPPAAKAPWTPPTLDSSTPSPIFGGSTGGLLRKAQVRGHGEGAREGGNGRRAGVARGAGEREQRGKRVSLAGAGAGVVVGMRCPARAHPSSGPRHRAHSRVRNVLQLTGASAALPRGLGSWAEGA